MIFLNTPNNKDLDAINKIIKKVTWHRCWNISIMNLDQLIFTWKGRHLVLALFASSRRNLKEMIYFAFKIG